MRRWIICLNIIARYISDTISIYIDETVKVEKIVLAYEFTDLLVEVEVNNSKLHCILMHTLILLSYSA